MVIQFTGLVGPMLACPNRVAKRIREDIAPKVAPDVSYQNAKETTLNTARMAHDEALGKVMLYRLKDDTQAYKQFVENESLRSFVGDWAYRLTSIPEDPVFVWSPLTCDLAAHFGQLGRVRRH